MMIKMLTMVGPIIGLTIAQSATGWAVFGAFSGAGFGLALTLTARRRRLQELNFWSAAILGGVVGVSLPVLWFGPQLAWAIPSLLAVWPLAATCGAFGMLLSSGVVAVAKEAEARELLSAADTAHVLDAPADL